FENWFDHRIDDEEMVTEIINPDQVAISGMVDDYSYILNCSGKEKRFFVGEKDYVIGKDEMVVMNFSEVAMRIIRGKGKAHIDLIDSEIYTCIDALDTYNRLFTGQYDIIDLNLRMKMDGNEVFHDEKDTRRYLYEAMRSRVFKGTSIAHNDLCASLGIWNDETDDRAKCSYDIQQVMRYRDADCRYPEGGNTVNFREPMIKGSLPEIECECRIEGESVIENICISRDHSQIMDDALLIYDSLSRYNIRQTFEYFTNDPIALEIAGVLDRMYAGLKTNADLQETIGHVRSKIIFAGAVLFRARRERDAMGSM
ncbi:MAG: hypothetical protein J5825_10730, partial [Lachnospiraceae bacterium]|nr:hypothetical protein [Lachnospiraceae bacterium]